MLRPAKGLTVRALARWSNVAVRFPVPIDGAVRFSLVFITTCADNAKERGYPQSDPAGFVTGPIQPKAGERMEGGKCPKATSAARRPRVAIGLSELGVGSRSPLRASQSLLGVHEDTAINPRPPASRSRRTARAGSAGCPAQSRSAYVRPATARRPEDRLESGGWGGYRRQAGKKLQKLSENLLGSLAATTRLPDSHHSYRSIDREIKMPLYARHGGSYLWLIERIRFTRW